MEKNIEHLESIISTLNESDLFSSRTLSSIKFDVMRLRARLDRLNDREIIPPFTKIHLGCGSRLIKGWLNVDVEKSDYDVDLACGRLPWKNHSVESIVGQHLIEHLDLISEFLPLLRELNRILIPGGELWLSCPDIEKICRSYLDYNMTDLLKDINTRWPNFCLGNIPASHLINHLFHQNGEHRNLYDFKLLEWALRISGFRQVEKVAESSLLQRFPEFPARKDDLQSIYVQASS